MGSLRQRSVVTIVLVDDHLVSCQGVAMFLQTDGGYHVAAQARSYATGLEAVLRIQPDVVITDISLPDRSGLELIQEIMRQVPGTRVLVLSMHDESMYAERALLAGAMGYVTKDATANELLGALDRIVAGETYVSSRMTAARSEPRKEGSDASPLPSFLSEAAADADTILPDVKVVDDINLADVITDACDSSGLPHDGTMLSMSLDSEVSVRADRALLAVALADLLVKAEQYAQNARLKPERPGLWVSLCKTDGGRAQVHIRDNGIGIAQDRLPRIFSSESDDADAGLSLTRSLSIVKAHEGTIEIHSCQGKYTEFVITLPSPTLS